MTIPVLLAKFLSAGAVAQAATGAGVVLVAVTGVGAVGALPAPAQNTFSTVVATVTPLTPPTSGEGIGDTDSQDAAGEIPVTALDDADTGSVEDDEAPVAEFDVAAWALAGPKGYDSHGAWVTASAENPDLKAALKAKGVSFGAVVSGWANGKGVDADVLAALGVESDESTDEPVTEQPTDGAPVVPVVEPTDGGGGSAAVESGTRGNSGKQAGAGKAPGQPQGQAKSNGRGNG